MPSITVNVTDEVAQSLTRQARALLLGRRDYVRSLLAAVAAEAPLDRPGAALVAEGGGRPETAGTAERRSDATPGEVSHA